MEKKLKITNSKQFETLVSELENNPSLAKGFSRGTAPANLKRNWEEIALKLNAVGPPMRDSEGWQKVWRDLKFKVKKKMVQNKAECNATGGGIFKQLQLSPLEEAVANLVQFQKQLNPGGLVVGVENLVQEAVFAEEYAEQEVLQNTCNLNIPVQEPSTSDYVCAEVTTPARKKNKQTPSTSKTERQCLLEKHTSMQENVLNEISSTMTSIKNILKDSNRYYRKMTDIEKKLKLLEKKNKREEELFQNDMELKKIKLDIKKIELEALNQS